MDPFEPQTPATRKLLHKVETLTRHRDRSLSPAFPPVLYMTDPKRTPDPLDTASRLPPGWGIIYRHFGATDRHRVATKFARIANDRALIFLIAADPQLALDVGAHGVHWPEARLKNRNPAQGFAFETASAHSRAGLARAAHLDLDAAITSSVFASNSPSASAAMGAARFRNLCRTAPLPVYGLGGITNANISRLSGYQNLAGIAAIDLIEQTFGTY